MKSLIGEFRDLLTASFQRAFPTQEVCLVTPAGKNPGDLVCPTPVKFFNMNKKDGCFGMANAKAVGQSTVDNIFENAVAEKIEVANNGFLNLFVKNDWIETQINGVVSTGNVATQSELAPGKVLVDFSSPNIAKEMHVGHLRSTIIGDAYCRCFEYLGSETQRVNHLGDWGTQFGMLLEYMIQTYPDYETNLPVLTDLEQFYKAARKCFDEDPEFKKRAQLKVVDLQAGNEDAMKIWKTICDISKEYLQKIYQRLDIRVEDFGESYYNPMIPGVIEELKASGLAIEDEGAWIVRVEGKAVPLMVVKSDGGYGYDSTDITAIHHRIVDLNSTRIVYVVDSGQSEHFQLVFEVAKMAGWHQPPATRVEHANFGVVLGPDGKKFKTKSGEVVKLVSLLDEAKERALAILQARLAEENPANRTHLSEEELDAASELIGVSAIKYYDLRQNRISTYPFSYDKMLDPKGNTAVYLIYAYARICSIIAKAAPEVVEGLNGYTIHIEEPQERNLCLTLCRFPDLLDTSMNELALNKLCELQYEIACRFSEFYNACKVLDTPQQNSRLAMCYATKLIMKQIFDLLGIKTLERL